MPSLHSNVTSSKTGKSNALARESFRSAVALNQPEFKGDTSNPSYAVDAESEGVKVNVDRADNDLTALELGRKYSEIFGLLDAVIINLTGTLFDDLQAPLKPYAGVQPAYKMLKHQDISIVLMTNSLKASKSSIVERMRAAEFEVDEHEVFTSTDACKEYLREKNLDRPYYMVHGDVFKDFVEEFPRRPSENAVIVGIPSTQFDYRYLSKGMSLLAEGAPLIALNMMKGAITPTSRNMALGPGPFISMLSACTDAEPVIVGKPSEYFYKAICRAIGISDYSKAVVIGDEIIEDIAGAKELGLKTILTRTGRYQLNDEHKLCPELRPDATAENFAMATRLILSCVAVSQMSEQDFIEEENSYKGCSSLSDPDNSGDSLAKKVEGYLKGEFKCKHCPTDGNNNPLQIPSYIW